MAATVSPLQLLLSAASYKHFCEPSGYFEKSFEKAAEAVEARRRRRERDSGRLEERHFRRVRILAFVVVEDL